MRHSYGETVIEGQPQRIVALDLQWTDVLTELGHAPIAASAQLFQGQWAPWQHADGIEAITFEASTTIPYEKVASFRPDLIVGTWQIADQAAYDTLTKIAPTIASVGVGGMAVDAWEDLAAIVGQIYDEADAASALVDKVGEVGSDLTGLDGKTYVLVNYVAGDQMYVVADPNDGAAKLFAKLGMSIDPDMLALDASGTGRVELSLEEIGKLDADVLLILTNGTPVSDIVGFDTLPAVRSGAYSVLEFGPVVGLNTPSPLSIPYSFDFIRPALEAAANAS